MYAFERHLFFCGHAKWHCSFVGSAFGCLRDNLVCFGLRLFLVASALAVYLIIVIFRQSAVYVDKT
jgi:ABC-type Mn2+/Zn2+ transport system permease subunit